VINPRCVLFKSYIKKYSLTQKIQVFHALEHGTGAHAPAYKLSAKLYDIYHCCVYSGKLLMMDTGTVRNM